MSVFWKTLKNETMIGLEPAVGSRRSAVGSELSVLWKTLKNETMIGLEPAVGSRQ